MFPTKVIFISSLILFSLISLSLAQISWYQTSAPVLEWYGIASSDDGNKLAAVDAGGGIYTSGDSGVTWVQTSAPNQDWFDIASSADGTKLAAVAYAVGIYTSGDSGVTWVQTLAPYQNWWGIASSADGTKLAAVVNFGSIWIATIQYPPCSAGSYSPDEATFCSQCDPGQTSAAGASVCNNVNKYLYVLYPTVTESLF